MTRAGARVHRATSDLSWMLSLCDLLANCLCAMLLLYALTKAAPAVRRDALAVVRASFSAEGTTRQARTYEGRLDTSSDGYWRFWLDRQLATDAALQAAGLRLANRGAAIAVPPAVRDDAAHVRMLAELVARSGRPALLVAPAPEVDEAARLSASLAAYLPADALLLAVEPDSGPWLLELRP